MTSRWTLRKLSARRSATSSTASRLWIRNGQSFKKLADARSALNEQFNKWIPESIATVGVNVKSKVKREVKPGTPCQICGFATHRRMTAGSIALRKQKAVH